MATPDRSRALPLRELITLLEKSINLAGPDEAMRHQFRALAEEIQIALARRRRAALKRVIERNEDYACLVDALRRLLSSERVEVHGAREALHAAVLLRAHLRRLAQVWPDEPWPRE
jgi:hypothetical protein